MAQTRLVSTFFIFFFLLSLTIPKAKSEAFSRKLSRKEMGLKKEKLTHLHFYFHDTESGTNTTAYKIVNVANVTSPSKNPFFGSIYMFDNPLTLDSNSSSKVVGRAQGMYASAAINEFGLLMVMNYNFLEGKYNGSTLSIVGRNAMLFPVREMPIVGGSGVFRHARGYVQAKTFSSDFSTGNAVVEYDAYVFHY